MAITRSRTWLDATLYAGRTYLNQKWQLLRDAQTRYQVYSKTYRDLSNLTDRELADIGVARSNISQVAHEAAFGA